MMYPKYRSEKTVNQINPRILTNADGQSLMFVIRRRGLALWRPKGMSYLFNSPFFVSFISFHQIVAILLHSTDK